MASGFNHPDSRVGAIDPDGIVSVRCSTQTESYPFAEGHIPVRYELG
jgi:hypothetical protein